MEKIIKAAVDRGASDLHIKAGDVFRARIDGKLVPLTKQRLTPDQTKAIAQRLIANDDDRGRIDKLRDYDCSWGMPGIGRFRVNILRQRSSFMIVMRVIPFDVPTFESLKLPAGHPFWSHPRVLVSPHVSAVSGRFWERETALIVSNISSYLAGAPLTNLVDREAGY